MGFVYFHTLLWPYLELTISSFLYNLFYFGLAYCPLPTVYELQIKNYAPYVIKGNLYPRKVITPTPPNSYT
jgi:hypothetical protein